MSAADYSLQSVYDLTNTVAVVTGGGTGIGIMIAKGLAANGAKVYIGGRRKEVLDKVASEWDGKGKLVPYVY
jgi:NADP-dependent 3-hydroxy acid dehydrogenase YdfG